MVQARLRKDNDIYYTSTEQIRLHSGKEKIRKT